MGSHSVVAHKPVAQLVRRCQVTWLRWLQSSIMVVLAHSLEV